MKAKLEIFQSDEGTSVYLNDTRLAGSRPYGEGERVLTRWVDKDDVLEALEADNGNEPEGPR